MYPLHIKPFLATLLCAGVILSSNSALASGADARREYVAGNYRAALPLAQEAAAKGDATAMLVLGMMHYKGQGVSQDYGMALKYWQDAARKGNAKAQNNLGMAFQNGNGVTKDYAEAVKWYRLAAKQNYGLAYSNLGVLYRFGRGVETDYKKSLEFLRKAEQLMNKDLVADASNATAIMADLEFVKGQIAEVGKLVSN